MLSREWINRIIIISFLMLVGTCLAKSVQLGSVLGFILALISLLAGIYFLYILAKAKQELERERNQCTD